MMKPSSTAAGHGDDQAQEPGQHGLAHRDPERRQAEVAQQRGDDLAGRRQDTAAR